MPDIQFRDVRSSDHRRICGILEDEWSFHLYSEEHWMQIAEEFLMSCLNGSDVAKVLTVDGEVAGAVVLKCISGPGRDFSADVLEDIGRTPDGPARDEFLEDLARLEAANEGFAEVF